jgi:hypothetical protein
MYNRRALETYSVEGLFDWVTQYHKNRPTSPSCNTEVTIRLNGDWAFPKTIVERWADDCESEGDPAWMAVVAFATLTPTPTKVPTPTATTRPTATARPSTTPIPTVTTKPSVSPTPSPNPTPLPIPAATGWNISLWMVFLAGVVIAGAFLIRRNKNT